MKRWIETCCVEPPHQQTVMARFGITVFDAAYSAILDQWYLVHGGTLEKIAEPEEIFVDSQYADTHKRAGKRREKSYKMRRQREEQLILI